MKNLFKKSAIVLLALLVLTACGKAKEKSPKEQLVDALTNVQEYTSFEASFKMDTSVEGGEVDPDDLFAGVAGINLSGELKADLKAEKTAATLKATILGMDVNVALFVDKDQLALQVPFLTQLMGLGDIYILSNLSDLVEDEEADADLDVKEYMAEMVRILNETINETVDAKNIEITEDQTLTTPAGDEKGKKIKLSMQDADMNKFLKTYQEKVEASEILSDDISADDITDATGTFEIELFLDSKGRLINVEIDTTTKTTLEGSNTETTTTSSIAFMLWNLNGNVKIEIPEFTPENSKTTEELEAFNPFEE